MGMQSHLQSSPVDQNESTAAFPGVPLHARAGFKTCYTWLPKPLFLMANNEVLYGKLGRYHSTCRLTACPYGNSSTWMPISEPEVFSHEACVRLRLHVCLYTYTKLPLPVNTLDVKKVGIYSPCSHNCRECLGKWKKQNKTQNCEKCLKKITIGGWYWWDHS